jgi:inner membrane protein
MDSLSQMALGAAVGVAVMGRRTAVWKSALWGAVAGTLPDLDVLIDHGDPIRNMVLHRAETHAPFWLSLFSLPFAALAAAIARLPRERALWLRWWLAMWLALVTHPLLDAMTVYGTQLALPFSKRPFGVGSIFIIDPLYTLPLIVGVVWALAARGAGRRGLLANAVGLVLSTAYLGWSAIAQQHVREVAVASIAAQGIAAERVLVTPGAFNTVLWRIVVIDRDLGTGAGGYHEGFYSLLDPTRDVRFDRFDRGNALAPQVQGIDGVKRLIAFSKGFWRLKTEGSRVLISDLRMGQEPAYIFTFAVAEQHSPAVPLAVSEQLGTRPDLARFGPWLWRRIRGEVLPPPR